MPELEEKWNIIRLFINVSFVKKYKLENYINHSQHYYNADFERDNVIKYPFNFPPFERSHSFRYQTEFLKLYSSLLLKYDDLEPHGDHLLFLAYAYLIEHNKKQIEIVKSINDRLKANGKLLVEMIKAPLPVLKKGNIKQAFIDYGYFEDEIEDYLLIYLGVVTGKKEERFKNAEGRLDWKKVSDEQVKKVYYRLLADNNLSLQMSNGNYLIISKLLSFNLFFPLDMANQYVGTIDEEQNDLILKYLIRRLFREQKNNNTKLYNYLLTYDFASNERYNELIKIVETGYNYTHHTLILKKVYDKIIKYIDDNGLFTNKDKPLNRRYRDNFIYQYFIIMGLFLDSNGVLLPYENIEQISEKLKDFRTKEVKKPRFASIYFADTFKNLKPRVKRKKVNPLQKNRQL